jgi:DivIVA domain-containing protein
MDSGRLNRLTPEEVQLVSFRAARRGRRGFDQDQVRAFCQLVQVELLTLAHERAALQDEVERLRHRILGQSGSGDRADCPPGAHVQAAGILFHAQQMADRYVAEAHVYGQHLAEEARRRRDDILERARWEARSAAPPVVMAAPVAPATEDREDC